MNRIGIGIRILLVCSGLYGCISCTSKIKKTQISLDSYVLEEGFELEMVASEPLLHAPVAMSFDDKGRIWVAEMPGYMSDFEGKGEDNPNGSIKILEDTNGDGQADVTKIFLDSLVLPRAIAHVYGGLLYAEPPYLYFSEIENDKPKNTIVVDSLYASDGNPEHQPNGLLMNIDNWIYNAKSNFRYRRVAGNWVKEPTTFRGQWGITKDNFGRLYYNDNATQLRGDYVLPNRLTKNEYMTPNIGVNTTLTKDQRVYPLQATLVNRGYIPGVLNADSLLLHVTAACSPLVYRGGSFPKEYTADNVFVCVPEGNLIKRNLLTYYGDSTAAHQAWQGKEFLASLDKGFRPVGLSNGPDGSMYVVDMHRGIIQHQAYSSPYYKGKAKLTQLDTLINYGRILRISKSGSSSFTVGLQQGNPLEMLNHDNGWLRDRAQQQLIQHSKLSDISVLRALVLNDAEPKAQVHALYVLEGTKQLSLDLLIEALASSNSSLVAHALVLSEIFIHQDNVKQVLPVFAELLDRNSAEIELYLATTLGQWSGVSESNFFLLLRQLALKSADKQIIREAILSGLPSGGSSFLNYTASKDDDKLAALNKDLFAVVENQKTNTKNRIYTSIALKEDNRTKGAKLFRQICASCHGIGGDGIEGLAPPLVKSEYLSKPLERLGLIILHGLNGPVHVNGKQYEFNQGMPGVIANESITDEDIAGIISYVTNSFSNKPSGLSAETIEKLREMKSKSGGEYTEKELLEMFLTDL